MNEEGTSRVHRQVKKKPVSDETTDRGIAVALDPREGVTEGYVIGRTIGTGEFEFARFDIELEATAGDRGLLIAWLRSVVKEIADREEAQIVGSERQPLEMALSGCEIWNRRLRISYGMTLQGKKRFESHRFDVQLRELIPADEGLEDAVQRFGEWLEVRVKEEIARVKGVADEGVGL